MNLSDLLPAERVREIAKWRDAYVSRLMEVGGFSAEEALANFSAAEDSHDYTDDPLDAADAELECWRDSV